MSTHQKQKGLTLIELMVVVAIVGVFATIALPSFQSTIQNNRLTSVTNEFLGALYFARSEAVKLGEEVFFCASKTTHLSMASIVCDNSASWHEGWIVWSDADADGSLDPNEILKVGTELSDNMKIYASASVASLITFSSRGLSGVSGTWQICDSRGNSHANAVIVSPSGRARASETDHIGGSLTCS